MKDSQGLSWWQYLLIAVFFPIVLISWLLGVLIFIYMPDKVYQVRKTHSSAMFIGLIALIGIVLVLLFYSKVAIMS